VHKSQLKRVKGQFKIDVMSDQQQKNVTRGGGGGGETGQKG
jgi:hypothetical protein